MKYREINEAVLYSDEEVCVLNRDDLEHLREKGLQTKEQRTRLCTHDAPESLVHEMFIVHTNDTYVRPHRHKSKTESFQVLQGHGRLVLFNDHGGIKRVIPLGGLDTDKAFYFKMPAGVWHMLFIDSEVMLFKEVTQGPFDNQDCEFPDWAPEGRRVEEVPEYLALVEAQISDFEPLL